MEGLMELSELCESSIYTGTSLDPQLQIINPSALFEVLLSLEITMKGGTAVRAIIRADT